MPTLKLKPTMAQKVDRLLKEAEDAYRRHFGEPVVPGVKPTQEQIDAAIFGYLYGISFNENAEIREVVYEALQRKFGWDDEYVATEIIGG